MEALIICGMPASGKTAVARILAGMLGVKAYGGGDVLREIAKGRGYMADGDDWWDTPQGIRFLEERSRDPELDREADKRMVALVKNGGIVVTSYTLPWLSEHGTKCWLEASLETRAARMANRDHISIGEARRVAGLRDMKNFEVYKAMYGIELGIDMKPFNIVLDVNNMTPEQAARSIQELADVHCQGV